MYEPAKSTSCTVKLYDPQTSSVVGETVHLIDLRQSKTTHFHNSESVGNAVKIRKCWERCQYYIFFNFHTDPKILF